jgi:hypothetical protein
VCYTVVLSKSVSLQDPRRDPQDPRRHCNVGERENENTSVLYYLLIDALSQACSISNKRSAGNDNELYRDNKGCHLPMPVSAMASIIFDRFNLD